MVFGSIVTGLQNMWFPTGVKGLTGPALQTGNFFPFRPCCFDIFPLARCVNIAQIVNFVPLLTIKLANERARMLQLM